MRSLKTESAFLENWLEVVWLVDAVPSNERARVESALGSCSVLSLLGGSSLGADRLETVSLLLIEDGFVLVSASDRGSARRIVVSLAGPGCVLLPPSAQERLEALSDARLTLVSANSNRLVLEIPAAALAIAEGLRGGLRDCRESLAQFASHRHADRVQRKLIQLAHTCGKVGNEGLLVDLPLTHELLAEMVGSTRETVTRALTQLAQEGILQHERGRYRIAVSPESIETE
jgi:CRP-like cAMP-binding protein